MKGTSQSKPDNKNLMFLFAYLLEWLSGLIVFFIAGEDKRLKFHGMQAIGLGIIAAVLGVILDFVFFPLAGLVGLLIWLYGMYIGYEAYTGKDVKVPVLGDYIKV